MEQHHQAITDYTEAIRLAPNVGDYYAGRAWSYQQLSMMDEALADYAQLAKINPQDVRVYDGMAMINFYIRQDFKMAVYALSIAIKLQPNTGRYYARGVAYAILGDNQRAIHDYNQALARGYHIPEVYQARGEAFARLGITGRAEADFARASELEASASTP